MGNLAEHKMFGDSVTLRGLTEVKGEKFVLANGLEVSFGDIIGLAGDFFAPTEADIIADGANLAEKQKRFLSAYDCLAKHEYCIPTAKELLGDAKAEKDAIEQGKANGKTAAEVYQSSAVPNWVHYQEDTLKGRLSKYSIPAYLKIASRNLDHFRTSANNSYSVGHTLAVEEMQKAFSLKGKNEEKFKKSLMRAYSLEAFSCHYLTDLFAAGHIRTPRREMYETASGVVDRKASSLCAKYQHDEDGNYGLKVTNDNGDVWRAYGDGHFFDDHEDEMTPGREIISKALQSAIDHLYEVATTGKHSPGNPALKYRPNKVIGNNHSPLFRIKAGTTNVVERRDDVANPYSTKYKENWWAVTTVTILYEKNVGDLPEKCKSRV